MNSRIEFLKSLTPYCGVYDNKEAFYSSVLDNHPNATRQEMTYAIQYIQVRNKNGVETSFYKGDVDNTHERVGLTSFLAPDGKFILLDGVYMLQEVESVPVLPFDVI